MLERRFEKVLNGRLITARLICGVTEDVLKSGTVAGHAVATDPPYGIKADKANAHSSIRDNDDWPNEGWDEEPPSQEAFDLILALAPRVAIWGGNYFADKLPASPGWLYWSKPEAETGFSLADGELCWTTGKGVVRQKSLPRRDGNLHPTQKPVALMGWTLDALKVEAGEVVVDPYMGSGTTAVACIYRGASFIGIDRSPRSFAIACQRVERIFNETLL